MRRLHDTAFRSSVAASLALSLAAGPARAVLPDDLRLGDAAETWRRTEAVPNPHAAFPCTRCHSRDNANVSYEVAHRFGVRMPLVTEGESAILLCEQCHKDYHPFHPVNFPVRRLAQAVERAAVFPLESPLEGYNKLTCTSCHEVHFPHTVNRLLRGFPVDERIEEAPFETRLDFCRACHGAEEILAISAHQTSAGESGCGLCHGTRKEPEAIGPLKRGLNGTCAFCHPPRPGEPPHYADRNPFPGLPQDVQQAAGVSLVQGRYTCATCHRHHRPAATSPKHTSGFLGAVAKSYLVNPHRSTRFCLNCHPGNPPPPGTAGAEAPLVDGDITRLCQRCHERENALWMRHPLTAPPEGYRIPAGWPLRKDGTLGCETCHMAGHGPSDPDNPLFLRGGTYRRRNDICFQCHSEKPLRGKNVHAEVAAGGGCGFCHEPLPQGAPPETGKVGPLKAEPNLLCLLCHWIPPHPGSAVHTVLLRPTVFLKLEGSAVPLTSGKITCHTCHDSHAVTAANRFLRTKGQQSFCRTCHPF